MPKGVLLVFSNCNDPARHDEYNSWYCHTHFPDLSVASGFVRARRYANAYPDDGPSQYLAVYEVEGPDVMECINDISRIGFGAYVLGRHIDCLESAGGYRFEGIDPSQYSPLEVVDYPPTGERSDLLSIPDFKPVARTLPRALRLVFSDISDPDRDEEFNRWYSHTHLPDLLQADGMTESARYRNLALERGPSKYLALYWYDHPDLKQALINMGGLAVEAREKHMIDCLDVKGLHTYLEIDADSYPPLNVLDYPREAPQR